jgi:uncharacterized protein YkwD
MLAGVHRLASMLAPTLALACTNGPDEPPVPEVPPDVAYCDDVREWDDSWTAIEDEVVVLLNERRAAGAACTKDLVFEPADPLTMNPSLRCAARHHARDMGEQDFFSNLDPDELDFTDRAESAGYTGTPLEQNIGAGQSSAERIVDAVMGSIELCAHVMNPEADEVGVGFLEFEGASFPRYWTQVFGRSE